MSESRANELVIDSKQLNNTSSMIEVVPCSITDDDPDNSKTPPQAGRLESLKYLRIMLLRVLAMNLLQEINELDRQSAIDDKPSLDFNAEVRRFEIELIKSSLIETRGRQRRAAVLLGLNSATFNRKVRQYGIELDLLEQSE